MFRGANKNRSLILTLSKEKRAILGGKVLIFSGLLFEEGEGLIKNTHLPPSNFGFYLAVSGYFGDMTKPDKQEYSNKSTRSNFAPYFYSLYEVSWVLKLVMYHF